MDNFFSLSTTLRRTLIVGALTTVVIASGFGSFFLEFDHTLSRWRAYETLWEKAYALEANGDIKGALELAREVRQIEENRQFRNVGWLPLFMGPRDLFEARLHEARLLWKRGWVSDAEGTYRQLIASAAEDFGEDSGRMAYTLYYYGKLLARTNRANEADPVLSQAEDIVAVAQATPPPSDAEAWCNPWKEEQEYGGYGHKFQREHLASWIRELRLEHGLPRKS